MSRTTQGPSTSSPSPIPCFWLRELAAGYLRGYAVEAQQSDTRWGFRFKPRHGRDELGFFVGFLTGAPPAARRGTALRVEPPECVVFAFVCPVAAPLYRYLVRSKGSLFRRSYNLLTKYTARRPRFELHEGEEMAVIRHVPLAAFPANEQEKYARNFFIETLALLVRSGLPEALVRLSGKAPSFRGC